MKTIQSIKGMNDVLPSSMSRWHFVEDSARALLESYGYREIRPPMLEKTELFKRSIGDVTDIVEKEMYTFSDRDGDSLTLRPECTASVVRAAIEHTLLRHQTPRFWYIGPMFRHERPQRGRYRQFHQIGAEAFGMPGPGIDAELILLSARFWKILGLRNIKLELNSLGSSDARARYRTVLVDYLRDHTDQLDNDSLRRLESNPLRILDSKNRDMQTLIEAAPKLIDHIDSECAEHFAELTAILAGAGVEYEINTRLVRGLDYYSRTVFEWTTNELGAQGTVCGGGRYDGLVEQIGGTPTPGVGFSMGIERLIELRDAQGQATKEPTPDAYLFGVGEVGSAQLHAIAETIRDAAPSVSIIVDAEPGRAKAKFRRADQSGAIAAIAVGESELEQGNATVKPLRGGDQTTIKVEAVGAYLATQRGELGEG